MNWGVMRRCWKLPVSEDWRQQDTGSWPLVLPSGKGHIALGLQMVTRDWNFGELSDFLATTRDERQLASKERLLPHQEKLVWLGGGIIVGTVAQQLIRSCNE